MPISNFYCVKNEATKEDPTDDFEFYCEIRDSNKSYYIEKGITRKWLNESSDERNGAGIYFQWPVLSNKDYIDALKKAKERKSPNNISPIINYKLKDGVSVLWMGDLERTFLDKIEDDLDLPEAHILFAPHHGRKSGKLSEDMLNKINPKIIIIGEAPSEDLDYYGKYNTITQNTAGDITLDCVEEKVHIYTSNEDYKVDFLDDEEMADYDYYLGTLNL
jgi:hypothetical protein